MVFLDSGADPHTMRLGLSIVEHARRLGRYADVWQRLLRMEAPSIVWQEAGQDETLTQVELFS